MNPFTWPGWEHPGETTRTIVRQFFRGFFQKQLLLHAAALSYTTIISLLPFLAVLFSLAHTLLKRMGPMNIERIINLTLSHLIPQVQLLEHTENLPHPSTGTLPSKQELIEQIKLSIEYIGSQQVGLLGSLFFLITAVFLLLAIEFTFNQIWKIKESRGLFIRFILHFSVLLISLLLFSAAIVLTNYWRIKRYFPDLPSIPYFYEGLQFLFPLILLWVGLTALYRFMPNTQNPILPAVLGGLFAGLLLQINNVLSVLYLYNVIFASRYYGWLGVLPILLLGLYMSWLIVLSGAQLAYTLEQVLWRPSPSPTA